MFNVEDIRSCIQEWFADAIDCVEVAKTYHEVVLEAESQLYHMMAERMNQEENP